MNGFVRGEVALFFDKHPDAMPLYLALERMALERFPDATADVQRTQITFRCPHVFMCAWPPTRRVKGRSGAYIGVTFGLSYRLLSPRVVGAVEPYPNRWTHHVLVERVDELDGELMGWIAEAYEFAKSKSKRRGNGM